MSSLPADGLLADVGDTLTTANAKTALEQLRDFAAERLGGGATSELTIAAGAVVPTGGVHSIDTAADGATDDLDTITTTNLDDGSLLLIYPENAARTVVVKDESGGAGQIHTADGNDFTMDEVDKYLILARRGADWYEVVRNYGTSLDDARSYLGLGTAAVVDTGVANTNVPAMDATGYPAANGSQITHLGAYMGDYILIQDQKAAGTQGGASTATTWHKRTLNTEVSDAGGCAEVAANQITLIAGTYYVRVTAPAFRVGAHKLRLHETTGTLSDIYSPAAVANTLLDVQSYAEAVGVVTISDANVSANQNIFEVQHYCSNVYEVLGWGYAYSVGAVLEIYTTVEMWRVE